jgi:hypothetical protein
MARTLLLELHAASTLGMAGLIWFVQIVQYPLLRRVGEESFQKYETAYVRRVKWVVAPLMLVEFCTAALLPWVLGSWALKMAAAGGVVMVAVVWLTTVFLIIPEHGILEKGFDRAAHRRLVWKNWIRTIAWSARGALALWLLTAA